MTTGTGRRCAQGGYSAAREPFAALNPSRVAALAAANSSAIRAGVVAGAKRFQDKQEILLASYFSLIYLSRRWVGARVTLYLGFCAWCVRSYRIQL